MKLTPWFVNGEKPAREGAYEVSYRKEGQLAGRFAFWSEEWGWGGASSLEYSETLRDSGANPEFFSEIGSWRGLAEEPKQ